MKPRDLRQRDFVTGDLLVDVGNALPLCRLASAAARLPESVVIRVSSAVAAPATPCTPRVCAASTVSRGTGMLNNAKVMNTMNRNNAIGET